MRRVKLLFGVLCVATLSFAVFSQSKHSLSDWRQYTASMAGFAVEYPFDWKLKREEASGRIWQIAFMSPGVRDYDVSYSSNVTICSKPRSSSFKDWGNCREKDDHLSNYAKNKVVSEEMLDLNQLHIRKKITEDRDKNTYIYAFFSTKARDFLISGSFPRKFNLEKQIVIFDQILSNFRSLEEIPVSIYRNDKYDFWGERMYLVK